MSRHILTATAAALIGAMLLTVAGSQLVSAQPSPQIVALPCPAPQPVNGVDVCVDRGDGAVYSVGDPITICATVNVPAIAIFPPPPPPTVTVTDSLNGGPERMLFQDAIQSGQRCVTATIMAPTGNEMIRATVTGTSGQVLAVDTALFLSTGQGQPGGVTAGVTVDRGPGSAYRIGEPITVCATATPADGVTAYPVRLVSMDSSSNTTFDLGTFAGTRCFMFQVLGPAGWGTLQVNVLDPASGAVLASDSVMYYAF